VAVRAVSKAILRLNLRIVFCLFPVASSEATLIEGPGYKINSPQTALLCRSEGRLRACKIAQAFKIVPNLVDAGRSHLIMLFILRSISSIHSLGSELLCR